MMGRLNRDQDSFSFILPRRGGAGRSPVRAIAGFSICHGSMRSMRAITPGSVDPRSIRCS